MIIKSFIFNHVCLCVVCGLNQTMPCVFNIWHLLSSILRISSRYFSKTQNSQEREVYEMSILICLGSLKEQRKNSTCPVILTFNMDWEGVVRKDPWTQINLGSQPGSASYCVIWSKILRSLSFLICRVHVIIAYTLHHIQVHQRGRCDN